MSTLVLFHAHPDDEAIATGGLMARASARGHRVVLVCATKGEVGEPVEGVLDEGEELWERRVIELAESCRILGADPPRYLEYRDSGMMGEPTNDHPDCFWQADHDEAVERLADILREVDCDVLTFYDNHGGYGHPDHIQVHRVGKAAGELLGIEHVYESTIDRDAVREFMEQAEDMQVADDTEQPEVDVETFGTPAADISYHVDVRDHIEQKKASIVAHASQVGPDSFFLTVPDEAFTTMFGYESYNIPGVTGVNGPAEVELLPGLE